MDHLEMTLYISVPHVHGNVCLFENYLHENLSNRFVNSFHTRKQIHSKFTNSLCRKSQQPKSNNRKVAWMKSRPRYCVKTHFIIHPPHLKGAMRSVWIRHTKFFQVSFSSETLTLPKFQYSNCMGGDHTLACRR